MFLCAGLLLKLSAGSIDLSKSFERSYTYESHKEYRKALEVLLPLERKAGNLYGYRLRLGWLYSLLGEGTQAVQAYSRASLILPEAFEPRLGLARVYLQMHQPAKAQISAKTVLEKDPLNYYANLYLAQALHQLGQNKAASAITRKMLHYYPTATPFLRLDAALHTREQTGQN